MKRTSSASPRVLPSAVRPLAGAARQVAAAGLAGAFAALTAGTAWAQQSWATPGADSYAVPVNVTSVQVDIAGAGGGGGGYDNTRAGAGGQGGALSAVVKVTPGDALAVVVGGGGEGGTSNFGALSSGTPRVRTPYLPAPWAGAGGAGASAGGRGGEPGHNGVGFSGGGGGGGGSSMVSFDAGGWAGRSFALHAGGGGGGSGDSVTGGATDGGRGAVGTTALASDLGCAQGFGNGEAGETIQGHVGSMGRAGLPIATEDGGGGGGGGGGHVPGSGGLYGYDGQGQGYPGAFEATEGTGGGSCFYAATAEQVRVVSAALTGGTGGPAETVWPAATGFVRTHGGNGQVTITPLAGMIQVQLNSVANWPAGQTADFQFQATCGGQTYPGSFSYSGAADTAVIDGVPLGISCTVSQVLPAAPAGLAWGTPSIAPTGAVTLQATSIPVLTITNTLVAAPTAAGVTAVPTLGEWALMLMGLGLAGLAAPALRRRRA
ncbi:MAG: IPTL-CTERM sorting domain-containing protein [Pseudomonadota bacterium]|nr:IPTL-CTERM sorting domain-containing protein [Pseudomonadota bacterium]